MAKLTARQRDILRARNSRNYACPPDSYPIHDPAHVASARAYYRRKYTRKCKGGKTKICAAAKKFGLMKSGYKGSAGWKSWCKR